MADQSRLEIVVDSRGAERNVRRVRDELEGVERSSRSAIRGTEGISSALSDADRAAGRYVDSAGKMREANGRFVAGAQSFSGATSGISSSAQSAAADLARLRTVAVAVGGALAAIGVTTGVSSAIREIADFQTAINGLSAVSGATGDSLAALEQQARTLGATSQFSAQQAAEGQRFLAQAGLDVNEILSATPGILQLATAAQLDLATAADIASNVLGGMGLEVSQLGRVNDVLAATASRSNTSIEQLGDALSYAAPFARAANVSLEEAAAAIGVMSDAGIQGSRAGTGLLGVIRQLSNVTPAAEKALNAAGLSIEDVNIEARGLQPVLKALRGANLSSADAIKIFGSEAGAAAQVLVSDYTGAITGAEGESQRMADTLNQGLGPAFKSLGSAISEATLQMGDSGLAGALESAVRGATGVISVWNGMGREFQTANGVTDEYMQTVEATATAVEIAAALIGGRLVAALGTATAGMVTATGAATALKAAVGGWPGILLAAGAGIYTFREELGLVPGPAKSVAENVDEITSSLEGLSEAMLDTQVAAFGAELVQIGLQADRLATRIESLKKTASSPHSYGQGQQGDISEGIVRAEAQQQELSNRAQAITEAMDELRGLKEGLGETGEAGDRAGNALDRLGTTADSLVAKFQPMLTSDVQGILDKAGPGATIDGQGQIRDAWGNFIPTLQRQLEAQVKDQLTAHTAEQNMTAGLEALGEKIAGSVESAVTKLVPTGEQEGVPDRAGAPRVANIRLSLATEAGEQAAEGEVSESLVALLEQAAAGASAR
ncbi:phage tail tape measure protein [uncultured Halomonas sp.]|uniref:phage tail tape measure protein n=1 Tax=uncultured Halomonas sp. TaxID=173971 RepID=UPI002634B116|nr:phage tail tape measure protein [uncultured Halomonas sp.]